MREEAHFDGRLLPETLEHALQHGGVIFGLIGELSRTVEDRRRILINSADFTSAEGIAKAQKEQGYIQGLEYVINFILEKANERSDEPDPDLIDGDPSVAADLAALGFR